MFHVEKELLFGNTCYLLIFRCFLWATIFIQLLFVVSGPLCKVHEDNEVLSDFQFPCTCKKVHILFFSLTSWPPKWFWISWSLLTHFSSGLNGCHWFKYVLIAMQGLLPSDRSMFLRFIYRNHVYFTRQMNFHVPGCVPRMSSNEPSRRVLGEEFRRHPSHFKTQVSKRVDVGIYQFEVGCILD